MANHVSPNISHREGYKMASAMPLPCEQLVSPTLPGKETTASNRLIFHGAYAKYVTSHVIHLTSLRLISRE